MTLLQTVVLICSIVQFQTMNCLEVQFDRVELLNDSYIENLYNVSLLRIAKFNRTTYVLNLNAEIFTEVTDDISIEVNFYFNRMNNNQYLKSPARVPKTSVCVLGEKYYRGWLMEQFKDTSNFPQLQPNQQFCPLPKGSYWLKNFVLDAAGVPKSAPSGHWMVEFTLYREDNAIAMVKFYVKMINSLL